MRNTSAFQPNGLKQIQLADTSLFSDANLVSYWRLDESSGDAADSKGSNTLTNANVTYTSAKFNNGAVFNSTSDTLQIADASQSGLDITGDFSFSGWVNSSANPTNSYQFIYSKWSSTSNQRGLHIYYENYAGAKKIGIDVSSTGANAETASWTYAIDTSIWYHIVYTYTASTAKHNLYVNGVSQGELTKTYTSLYNNTAPVSIGNEPSDTKSWSGTIDDVAIFSKVLSAGEIQQLYFAGSTKAYYPLNGNTLTSADAVLTNYEGSNDNYENTGTTTNGGNVGQSIQLTYKSLISKASIYGSRGNAASGTFKLELLSGSYTGTVVATTGTLTTTSALSVYGSPAWNELTFTTPVELQSSTTYYLKLTVLSGSTTDEIRWSEDTTAPSYSGGTGYTNGSATANDRNFRITGKSYSISTDYSGNSNHATETAITYPQGRFGQAAKFNGSTSDIALTFIDPDSYNTGLTVSAWAKFDVKSGNIVSWDESAGFGGVEVAGAATNWSYRFGSGSSAQAYDTGVSYRTGKWYHVLITHDTTNNRMYVDGNLIHSAASATLANSNTSFRIGGNSNIRGETMNGLIDEVIIESRAWTAKEVETYYRKSMLNYKPQGRWSMIVETLSNFFFMFFNRK